ncbi:MAG: DUF1214 domain-containing protein [Myxococcota bacterium]
MPNAPKLLAEAYETWLDAQRRALELMTSLDQPGTPQDWAEGYRWLTRIASLCQDWVLEKEDPLRPTIFRNQDEYRKLIVDNPDVNYWFASVRPEERYRLYGNRGGAPYLGFTIGTDVMRGAQGRTGTLGQHYIDQFEVEPNGDFEILAAGERPPAHVGNFMRLPEGTAQIAVRETFTDRKTQRPAALRIERLGEKLPAPRAQPEQIAEKLVAMSRYLLVIAHTCAMLWKSSAANTNRIVGVAGAQHVKKQANEIDTHSDTDMVYMGGRFRLEPGEALRITLHKPPYPFVYWGLVLVNPWMESYDFRHTTTHLSNGTAVPDANGDWTLVVAPEDPGRGVRNWLDAGGRREGFMLLRWVLAGDTPPQPSCELVTLASLR